MKKALKKVLKGCLRWPIKQGLLWVHRVLGPPRVLRYGADINLALLRAGGATVGHGVQLNPLITLYNVDRGFRNLHIGNRCVIHSQVHLDLTAPIILEDGVSLGPRTTIMTHNRYNFNPLLEDVLAHTCGVAGVTIKRGSGIKAGALIVQGVTIGPDAVVAGNAVVNRDVEARTFVGGIPARLIRRIEASETPEE